MSATLTAPWTVLLDGVPCWGPFTEDEALACYRREQAARPAARLTLHLASDDAQAAGEWPSPAAVRWGRREGILRAA